MISRRNLASTLLLASLLANLSCVGKGCSHREYTTESRVEVTGTPTDAVVAGSAIRTVAVPTIDSGGSSRPTTDRFEQEFSILVGEDIELVWFLNAPPPLTLPETAGRIISGLTWRSGDAGSNCAFFLEEFVTELSWSPSIGKLDGGEVPHDFYRHVEFRLKITSEMFRDECEWVDAPDIDLKIEMEATSKDVSYTGSHCAA